jgi:hypothetical protein
VLDWRGWAARCVVRGRGENQHKLNDVTESVDQRSNGASRPFYFPEKKIQNKLTVDLLVPVVHCTP